MSSPDFTPTKQCSKCRTIKPVTLFARNRSAYDGHQNQCKECRAAGYRAQKARGGPKKRTTDDTITPGNPLSDIDSEQGRREALDICSAVAGRVIRQCGGLQGLAEGIDDEEIALDALWWIQDHPGEASRIEQRGTAVIKITERLMRVNRAVYRREGTATLPLPRTGKRRMGPGHEVD